jgi:hypothetical protein
LESAVSLPEDGRTMLYAWWLLTMHPAAAAALQVRPLYQLLVHLIDRVRVTD